jgi:hypothetical protein
MLGKLTGRLVLMAVFAGVIFVAKDKIQTIQTIQMQVHESFQAVSHALSG